ncbi:hypothetical protein [Hydrogenophaga sp.]|uniref:hypothetical protein n=1 Tax=Hydrogenophaga sp. TaxID=1904254 RepID=UPI002720E95F|nr:hypothetical protein [Hydrogenophaga sp.]MDO9435053.1 hypothetical protein [Hydrogenophaga sp.]
MNRFTTKTLIVTSAALSCAAAFAAGTLNAKVVAVQGDQVSLETPSGAVPPTWLKPGAAVQALGWQTKVVSVQGSKVVLSLAASKSSNVKVQSDVVVREIPTQEKYGC